MPLIPKDKVAIGSSSSLTLTGKMLQARRAKAARRKGPVRLSRMRLHFVQNTSFLLLANLALTPAVFGQKAKHPVRASHQEAKVEQPAYRQDSQIADSYYHYMLAHNYEQQYGVSGSPQDAQQAVSEYQLALKEDPNSDYLKSHIAQLDFSTGNIQAAITAAKQQIAKDPKDVDAHRLLANIYLQSINANPATNQAAQNMLAMAISQYQTIVSLEAHKIDDRIMLGRLYSANNQPDKAEAEFKQACQMDPNSDYALLSLARFYSEQNETEKSLQLLQSIPAGRQSPRVAYALGKIYDVKKEPHKAIAAYQRALLLEPSNPNIQEALAKDLYAEGQYDQALPLYQELVTAEPKNGEAYQRISNIERANGQFEQAYQNLMKARALNPYSVEIAYDQGLLADALGHYQEAEALFSGLAALSDHPSNIYSAAEKTDRFLFLNRLANVYTEQNKTDQAAAVYEQMALLGGDYAEQAYQSEVSAYSSAHEYAKALATAQKAVKQLPDDQAMKLLLAGEIADNGNPKKAIKLEKSLLTGSDKDNLIYLSMAQVETRAQRWKQARKYLDKAEKLSTTKGARAYVTFMRGVLAEQQGQLDEAEAQFRKVLALDPNNAMTLNYLGYMMADRGQNLPEALAMIQKAVTLEPLNYAYLDSLGWAYFKMGNYKQAERNLHEAVERDSTDPTVHDHLGQLYAKMGQLNKAKEQWEKSLTEFAKTLPADQQPGELSAVQKRLNEVLKQLAEHPIASNQTTPSNTLAR